MKLSFNINHFHWLNYSTKKVYFKFFRCLQKMISRQSSWVRNSPQKSSIFRNSKTIFFSWQSKNNFANLNIHVYVVELGLSESEKCPPPISKRRKKWKSHLVSYCIWILVSGMGNSCYILSWRPKSIIKQLTQGTWESRDSSGVKKYGILNTSAYRMRLMTSYVIQ